MKPYFLLLSDTNIGLIIAATSSIATLLVSLVLIPLLNKIFNKQLEIRAGQQKTHTLMDGMKSELVEATGLYREALGKAAGRAELKEEQKKDTTDPVQKVEVVKPAEVIVIDKPL